VLASFVVHESGFIDRINMQSEVKGKFSVIYYAGKKKKKDQNLVSKGRVLT